jgi:hypothetical protein
MKWLSSTLASVTIANRAGALGSKEIERIMLNTIEPMIAIERIALTGFWLGSNTVARRAERNVMQPGAPHGSNAILRKGRLTLPPTTRYVTDGSSGGRARYVGTPRSQRTTTITISHSLSDGYVESATLPTTRQNAKLKDQSQ